MERSIVLPHRTGTASTEHLLLVDNIVIVGANGSGKSRLGSRIEHTTSTRPVKRISAQRILSLPDFAPVKNLEQALNELVNNWRNRSVIELQGDYEHVLSTMFAHTARRDADYVELCRDNSTDKKPPIPESAIERLIRIWNEVLPQRLLMISDGKVAVKIPGGSSSYSGREMSDGEKVALYLIAQTLCLPENCLVIIDEPELHLHKSLMSRLWNNIEAERPDCIFMYITHDLDFAASRVRSTKIWVKSYANNSWTWELVPDVDEIPENLLLEIIGSRKPILFVEGERGSYDHAIYQLVYPLYTIIPRGGCDKVIESVKGIRGNAGIHEIGAYGLIDLDFRSKEEIDSLVRCGIQVIQFAEVENLLLVPDLIRAVAKNQALNEDAKLKEVQEYVFNSLRSDLQNVISRRTSHEVNFRLNAFDNKQVGEGNIKKAIAEIVARNSCEN
jgi:hypothetical protein